MYRIVYISTPKPDIGPADVAGILEAGRKNNIRNEITGLLVQDSRRFLQYLEGEQDAVETTFARISCDNRHLAIIPLKMGLIGRRQFPDWAMASRLVDIDNSLENTVAELVVNCDHDVATELLDFAKARDRAA